MKFTPLLINYTRSSVVATFRKDKTLILEDRNTPESAGFFEPLKGMTELQLRRDASKWETTLHKSKTFENGLELRDPVFDLHYVPREGGKDAKTAKKIPYAMIITVSSPLMPDLYNQVVNRYRHKLQPLKPRFRFTARGS